MLGLVHGHALAIAATGALISFAVGCFTSVLQSLLDLIGTLLSVVILVVIGNPAAGGGQIPPSLMPAAWGWLGRVLPNPAGMTAVRSIEFFSGHGSGQPFLVLSCYAAIPIAVMLAIGILPGKRQRAGAPQTSAGLAGEVAAETAPGAML